jgi:general secretion pathway protein E
VLSTLHTNTAIGAVSRLVDMGVERFLLAPMLVGVVAQRLVRRLCPECRTPDSATAQDADLIEGLVVGDSLFRACGCEACHGQGYRGRSGIYEVVAISREIEALIYAGASEAEMTLQARREGPGLIADGLRQIRAGLTTVEDVARVAQEG